MKRFLFCFFIFIDWQSTTCAQQTGKWGDQGDGTYRNPIIAGDYSDPDVIRVGRDYYMITSTFQFSPGMAVLHSVDLVNWETIGSVVSDISALGPNLNWDKMNSYNTGIYAGSIRHHKGKFYVYFTSFLEGFFVATATRPQGPWQVQPMKDKNGKLLLVPKWDDPCPFWDDDGKAYLVASKPGAAWYSYLFQMSENGIQLLDTDADSMKIDSPHTNVGTVIYRKQTSEGNKILKINGYYYHYNNEVIGSVRVAMMKRSKNIYGTKEDGTPGRAGDPGIYEKRQMIVSSPQNREPNQGALIETPEGNWYFITQVGKGGFPDGRTLHLLPVEWKDGFPFAGRYDDKLDMGQMCWQAPMPYKKTNIKFPQGSDEFNTGTLQPQWQWNYQPRAGKWSLTERKGYLRLYAFKPLQPGKVFKAGNTIAQRYLSSDTVMVTIKIDISKMANGQDAGFTHFNGGKNYSNIGVQQANGVKVLKYEEDGKVKTGIEVPASVNEIWFRSAIGLRYINQYSYSFNGKDFIPFGDNYLLKWGNYRGDNMGIYNYNNESDEGYIDVDWFHYNIKNR